MIYILSGDLHKILQGSAMHLGLHIDIKFLHDIQSFKLTKFSSQNIDFCHNIVQFSEIRNYKKIMTYLS